jgi:hypothetical protein
MRTWLKSVCASALVIACGASAAPSTKSAADRHEASTSGNSQRPAADSKERSKMSDWSEVPSNESKQTTLGGHKSQVVVASHPTKHGDGLHFHFEVNSVPISGVFSAPGGQTSTFTIPVGTVRFTVDECEGDVQGFELSADEKMPIKCELTTEGDCCEVAIPAEQ